MFPWHRTKNVPFQFPLPLVLTCLGGKVAQYGGKNRLHGKGGGSTPFTISVSGFTLFEKKKKKETTLLEADVDTVSVIEDGKSSLSRCGYKGVLMAGRVPVMDLLPSCGRTAEATWNPN